MELIAQDGEPIVASGPGALEAVSPTLFTYEFKGLPDDVRFALHALNRMRDNPYDGISRFRLIIEDEAGVEFNAGWTSPTFNVPSKASDPWTFSGECDSLVTQGTDGGPFSGGCTEARYIIPRGHHVWLTLRDSVGSGRKLEILGTTVCVTFDSDADMLVLSAPASDGLPLLYTENWLGEPLRILFGQLIFPRLVARAFGERGDAQIWVRPSPRWTDDSNWIAFWKELWPEVDGEELWTTYAALLTFIASARGDNDQRNFESNKLTNLYEEIIQATRGSRWVTALTIASSIEGLVWMLVPYGAKRGDADTASTKALCEHIANWGGDKRLKKIATNALLRDEQLAAARALRNLAACGFVREEGVQAWDRVRNKVMHGNLVSPYSSEEDDGVLMNMAGLLHALTLLIVTNKEAASSAACAAARAETSL